MKENLEVLKSKDFLLKNSADLFVEEDKMWDKNKMDILKYKYNGFLPIELIFKTNNSKHQNTENTNFIFSQQYLFFRSNLSQNSF